MKVGFISKILQILVLLALLSGCTQSPFILEFPENSNVIHRESGLYVHREVELRVNAARLQTPPAGTEPGAISKLNTDNFFPLGCGLSYFIPSKYERCGDDLVWKGITHLSDYDLKGKTSLGANVCWDKDGAVTVKDVLEIFEYAPPDTCQLNKWSPWVEASRRRGGVFSWHAEANKHAPEDIAKPLYPFQMRFRLVLNRKMYL